MNESGSGPSLSVQNLVKRFGDIQAVDGITFSAPRGSFLSLLGPSGSGKTTVLRLISGFERPEQGSIAIDGADVTNLPPYRRDIGVVFQNYALFPHLTVHENLAFPLKRRRIVKSVQASLVDQMLTTVGLPGRGRQYPDQLSGGEQQRVALARALVFKPRILVMDEPLSALDKHLRERMQEEIRGLQKKLGITTIYVTHDQSEAFAMSDLVAVINRGRVEQIGVPRDLYENPRTEFVARFLGDSNIFTGEAVASDSASTSVRLSDANVLHGPASETRFGQVKLLVRPGNIRINSAEKDLATCNSLQGHVTKVTFAGEILKYTICSAGQDLLVHEQNRSGKNPFPLGGEVTLTWLKSDTCVL